LEISIVGRRIPETPPRTRPDDGLAIINVAQYAITFPGLSIAHRDEPLTPFIYRGNGCGCSFLISRTGKHAACPQ